MTGPVHLEAAADRAEIPAARPAELTCRLRVRTSPVVVGAAPLEVSICLLFDCSASMIGRKLQTSIAAAKAMLELMPPSDRLSLVGFQSKTRLFVDHARPTGESRDTIGRQIERIRGFAGGSTNLAGGIEHATRVLASRPADARVILVLSDGRSDSPGKAEAAALAATRAGIQLFAVGIGEDYEADRLLAVVAPSNGVVFGERDLERLAVTFAHLLGRVDSFVASSASVALALGPGVTAGAVSRTSPERAFLGVLPVEADGSVRVRLGNLEAAATYELVFTLGVPARAAGTFDVARATLTYDSGGVRGQSQEVVLTVLCGAGSQVTADGELGEAARAARAARLVHELAAAQRAGDRARLATRLGELARHASESGDAALEARCREVLARVEGRGSVPAGMLNALVLGVSAAPRRDSTSTGTRPAVPPPLPPRAAGRGGPSSVGPPETAVAVPALPVRSSVAAYDLVLVDPGEALIAVIREVRALTGLSLREVSDRARAAPAVLLTAVARADAVVLQRKLASAGAKVELRPTEVAAEPAGPDHGA